MRERGREREREHGETLQQLAESERLHSDTRRLEEVERLLAEALRRLDESEHCQVADHTDIMRALAHVSSPVSFMPTTTTSPVSGRPQTSPTIARSDQGRAP